MNTTRAPGRVRPPHARRRRLTVWLTAVVGAGALAAGIAVALPAAAFNSEWTAVSAGASHTCGIKTDTTLWCWGGNDRGQLGVGDHADRYRPTQVADFPSGWTAVSAGNAFTCGIRNGYRYCWGANEFGQLGLGDANDRNRPRRLTSEPASWASITAGRGHACAVRTNGTAFCWGLNAYGAVGDGTTGNTELPATVSGGHTWRVLSAGAHHTCGITTAGYRYCWGANEAGELGLGADTTFHSVPATDGSTTKWQTVEAGDFTTCAITITAQLQCWGKNAYAQAGVGISTEVFRTPRIVGSTMRFDQVTLGGGHTCAVRSPYQHGGLRIAGETYCWGRNDAHQLGLEYPNPAYWEGRRLFHAWTALSAGSSHTCAIGTNRWLYCWGYNVRGQLGYGTASTTRPLGGSPTPIM